MTMTHDHDHLDNLTNIATQNYAAMQASKPTAEQRATTQQAMTATQPKPSLATADELATALRTLIPHLVAHGVTPGNLKALHVITKQLDNKAWAERTGQPTPAVLARYATGVLRA